MRPDIGRRVVGRLFALALAALAAGCGAVVTQVDVETRDETVIMPTVRATYQVDPEPTNTLNPQRRMQRSPGDAGEGDVAYMDEFGVGPRVTGTLLTTFSLDAEFSFGYGDSVQSVSGGREINYDEVSIPGPAMVEADYDLYYGSITGRSGWLFQNIARLEGIAGVGFQNLELELEAGAVRDFDATFSLGPLIGARFTLEPFDWLALYGQATNTFGFGEDYVNLGTLELGMAIAPLRGLSLIGGWRWIFYDEEREEFFADPSDVDLELSGPVVGLLVRF